MKTNYYIVPKHIKEFARYLRRRETKAEKKLWSYLRNKKLDWYKFYRQKPIFVYKEDTWKDRFIIADFYCHKKRLIIEVDGGIHLEKRVKDYDKLKEYLLKERWYKILRIKNKEIYENIEEVLKKIREKM